MKYNEFWERLLENDLKRSQQVAIIDGHHYVIEPEDDKSGSRGFGGDKFVIHFNDGREVVTTNLWCQGEIPENYKDKFPNNANFDWKWKWIGDSSYLVPKK